MKFSATFCQMHNNDLVCSVTHTYDSTETQALHWDIDSFLDFAYSGRVDFDRPAYTWIRRTVVLESLGEYDCSYTISKGMDVMTAIHDFIRDLSDMRSEARIASAEAETWAHANP